MNKENVEAFVLASLISSYPDASFKEQIDILLEDESLLNAMKSLDSFQELFSNLKALSEEELENIRSDYIDLFDRGRQVNSLYETEYGKNRSLVKGNELIDVAGFYKAFGFDIGSEETIHEMVDHASVELEFYALLIMKQLWLLDHGDQEGVDIVEDARKKFLSAHLGRFIGAICERPGVKAHPFYQKAFEFCKDIVQNECRKFKLEIQNENWISEENELAEVTCGGSVGCLK